MCWGSAECGRACAEYSQRIIPHYLLTVNKHCEVLSPEHDLACSTVFCAWRLTLHAEAGCVLTIRFIFAYDCSVAGGKVLSRLSGTISRSCSYAHG